MENTNKSIKHWLVALAAFLLMAAAAIATTCLSFFVAPVTSEFGFSRGAFLIYFTLLNFAMVLSMPITGKVFFKVGAVKTIAITGLIGTLALVAFSFSTSLIHFYAVGIVLGLAFPGACALSPAILVNIWFKARKGLVMGVVMAAAGVSGAIFSMILPGYIAANGWRAAYLLLAGCFFLTTVPLTVLFVKSTPQSIGLRPYGESDDPGTTASTGAALTGVPYAKALKSPAFFMLYFGIMLIGLYAAFIQHIPVFFTGRGMTGLQTGSLMTIFSLALIVTKILAGVANDKIGTVRATVIFCGMVIISFLMLNFTSNYTLYSIALVLFSFIIASQAVLSPLVANKVFGPKDYSGIWGVLATAGAVGMAIGAPLWGTIYDVSQSYSFALYSPLILIPLLFIVLFYALKSGNKLEQQYGKNESITG